ncbi:MAG: hypothetical protein QG622_1454 [Actinomycetota bacterium]|nr:hypothetical protein [Actinomycetota bacterium]
MATGLVVLALATGWVTAQDHEANQKIEILRSATRDAVRTGEVEVLKRLASGGRIEAADLADVAAFVASRGDGSDFRMATVLRAAYSYGGTFPPEVERAVREMVVGFRYWMTEPGTTPAVYWSENHQILFSGAEFLAGRRYPAARFADGRTGEDHARDARGRIWFWLDQRCRFGFSEWNSHYYTQDLAALANLVDFAGDDEIVRRATAVTDLLFFDMATQSFRTTFIATSGRLYENNKRYGDTGVNRIMRWAFLGSAEAASAEGIEINVVSSTYKVPPVLRAIALDPGDAVVQASYGRDLPELDDDRSLSAGEHRIMALWGMQAFTNPEALGPSLRYARAHSLFSNPYLAPLRQLNYRALLVPGVLPLTSTALDLPTDGTVLTRANTYTFRTPDYTMSTTQAYRPGEFGDQHHIFGMTFADGVTLLHTHPAVLPGEPQPNGSSPGYWTGTGILPLSCQERSVNLSLYRLPSGPGRGRRPLLTFTHLHLPLSRFSRVVHEDKRLFLQYGEALVAVTGTSRLRLADSEVVQEGRQTSWITEASTTRTETFEAFADRIRKSAVSSAEGTVAYTSAGRRYTASLGDGCTVDGTHLVSSYPRHESKYAQVKRNPTEFRTAFDGQELILDFARGTREVR